MKFLKKNHDFLYNFPLKFYVMFLQLEIEILALENSQSVSDGNSLFNEKVYFIVYLLLFYSID